MRVLSRGWVPMVVAVAVVLGGVAVVELRDAFGSEAIFSASGRDAEPLESVHVKQVTYDLYGSRDMTGSVNYLDANAHAQQVKFIGLPWSVTVSTTAPAVLASVVAQGDGDSIGCRITVNGEVKDERQVGGYHAQTSCLVKAA